MGDNGGGPVLNLLKLPDKAIDGVLSHLNVFHLMNLRLVCKTTKSWVELPSHLKRFFVHVKTRKFLKTLHRSSVKWSNLTITCDTNDPTNTQWIQRDEYFQTFSRLNTALRVLRFTEQRISYTKGLDVILRNCTELETLEIGTLDLQKADLPIAPDVINNLKNLRSLGISYVAWDQEKDLEWFRQVLEAATNLSYFRVPFILSSSVYNLYPSLDVDEVDDKLNEITDRYLFTPIKDALATAPENKLKRLQVENFDLEQLLQNQLLQSCQQSSCLLLNVLECFERTLNEQETTLLGGTLGSLVNISKFLDLSTLKNLQSISIMGDCVNSSDTDKKFCTTGNNPSQLLLPALKSVCVTLTSSILQSERIAYCFLQQLRPTVTFAAVTFQSELRGSAQASVFRTPQFATSFPNLESLQLNGFDGKADAYLLMWKSFPCLTNISLENCRTLDDKSLIGEDEASPAFLQLKQLKRLSLEFCGGDLTDSTLSLVISKIPLESLALALPKITFTKGLSCLAQKDSPLFKSLMQFQCMKPDQEDDSCSDETFQNYLSVNTFINLKKAEILF